MFQNDGRVFVRRRQHERFHQDSLAPTVKFDGGEKMMWGAMSYRGTGILTKVSGILDAKGYIKILEDAAVPSAHLLGYGDVFWYQDDGAPRSL